MLKIPNNKYAIAGYKDTGKADETLQFGDAVISLDGGEIYQKTDTTGAKGTHGVVTKRGDKDEISSGDETGVLIDGLAVVEASEAVEAGQPVQLDGSNQGKVKKIDTTDLSSTFGIAKKGRDSAGQIIVEVL